MESKYLFFYSCCLILISLQPVWISWPQQVKIAERVYNHYRGERESGSQGSWNTGVGLEEGAVENVEPRKPQETLQRGTSDLEYLSVMRGAVFLDVRQYRAGRMALHRAIGGSLR